MLAPVSKKNHNFEATRLHFDNLVKRYGNPIIILNLIKQLEKSIDMLGPQTSTYLAAGAILYLPCPCGENNEGEAVTLSQLKLIDLAGSESSKVETTGMRRREGSYINKSLLTLGTSRVCGSREDPIGGGHGRRFLLCYFRFGGGLHEGPHKWSLDGIWCVPYGATMVSDFEAKTSACL
ncbi:hypothetical protein K1719_046154 [Acacia pycnantha]|nr:hypothetical protein K1719_046154 [Acacia pycnantha]